MPTTSIIVDIEATCCNDASFPRHQMEIIEIGAVAVDSYTGEFDSEYQTFIRPVRNPILTDFCKELTNITQDQVDSADCYPTAMKPFREWLASLGDYDFCSWGDYDRKQFVQDSEFHRCGYPFAGPHRNLKVEFAEAIGAKKKMGVGGALKHLGLEFEGTPHRGIDDAHNIARIYREMLAIRGL
ncbi:MAG: exonuclease [Verrucomicrobiales bacterium]|nr:exonuclease [Verrucomicrobiales bacterium]